FIVSFGYRHILPLGVLQCYLKRAINIHISYLPWNRGADPNLWSFLEDTPKGVSIHYLTEKIDAGDILCQEEIRFGLEETLRSSYDRLVQNAMKLFMCYWPEVRGGHMKAVPQNGRGSFHLKQDVEMYRHLLSRGWETPVRELIGKALSKKESAETR
ncbi:MAG: formyl transferase, partial [Candidatus Omnitrophica bacterium CG1_02_49_16]